MLYAGQRVAVTLAGLAIVTNALTWLNIALTPVAFVCFLLVFPLFAGGLLSFLNKTSPGAMEKAWAVRSQSGSCRCGSSCLSLVGLSISATAAFPANFCR
jgi:hypothetical protein